MKKSFNAVLAIMAVFSVIAVSSHCAWASGNLRYTITVTKFANEAGWSGL
jgi:hypothetical protein